MSDVIEIARMSAKPGSADLLAAGMEGAVRVLASVPGCRGAGAHRCVEDPDAFVLLVTWSAVSDHGDFRSSPAFAEYRSQIQDHLAGAHEFAHYEPLASALPPG
jgi:quinol monooxygenase YgiN